MCNHQKCTHSNASDGYLVRLVCWICFDIACRLCWLIPSSCCHLSEFPKRRYEQCLSLLHHSSPIKINKRERVKVEVVDQNQTESRRNQQFFFYSRLFYCLIFNTSVNAQSIINMHSYIEVEFIHEHLTRVFKTGLQLKIFTSLLFAHLKFLFIALQKLPLVKRKYVREWGSPNFCSSCFSLVSIFE